MVILGTAIIKLVCQQFVLILICKLSGILDPSEIEKIHYLKISNSDQENKWKVHRLNHLHVAPVFLSEPTILEGPEYENM